ncbi:hypothetical protein RCL1_003557 [Eukaryota sp. TZLM3-RCL]
MAHRVDPYTYFLVFFFLVLGNALIFLVKPPLSSKFLILPNTSVQLSSILDFTSSVKFSKVPGSIYSCHSPPLLFDELQHVSFPLSTFTMLSNVFTILPVNLLNSSIVTLKLSPNNVFKYTILLGKEELNSYKYNLNYTAEYECLNCVFPQHFTSLSSSRDYFFAISNPSSQNLKISPVFDMELNTYDFSTCKFLCDTNAVDSCTVSADPKEMLYFRATDSYTPSYSLSYEIPYFTDPSRLNWTLIGYFIIISGVFLSSLLNPLFINARKRREDRLLCKETVVTYSY